MRLFLVINYQNNSYFPNLSNTLKKRGSRITTAPNVLASTLEAGQGFFCVFKFLFELF